MLNYKINSFAQYRELLQDKPPLHISLTLSNRSSKISLELNMQLH